MVFIEHPLSVFHLFRRQGDSSKDEHSYIKGEQMCVQKKRCQGYHRRVPPQFTFWGERPFSLACWYVCDLMGFVGQIEQQGVQGCGEGSQGVMVPCSLSYFLVSFDFEDFLQLFYRNDYVQRESLPVKGVPSCKGNPFLFVSLIFVCPCILSLKINESCCLHKKKYLLNLQLFQD